MANILFALFGSAGDAFPAIAVGKVLGDDGHAVTILAPRSLGLYARTAGLRTAVIGDASEMDAMSDDDLFTNRFNGLSSWRNTFAKYVSPLLVDDQMAAMRRIVGRLAPDLIVVHPLAPYGSLVAAQLGIPWISLHLYPQLAPADRRRPTASALFGGTAAHRIRDIERSSKLRSTQNPVRDWGWSRLRNLSVHDPALVARTRLKDCQLGECHGFPYWDDIRPSAADEEILDEFAEMGDRPKVLVTMGSFIGLRNNDWWPPIVKASLSLGAACLLVNGPSDEKSSLNRSSGVRAVGFVPMSSAATMADVIIHHGGIGTTYATLLAGKPSVTFPCAFDQAFNGALLEDARLGWRLRSLADVRAVLGHVLADSAVQHSAAAFASQLVHPRTAARALADRVVDSIPRQLRASTYQDRGE